MPSLFPSVSLFTTGDTFDTPGYALGLSKRKHKAIKHLQYRLEPHIADCLTLDVVVSSRQKDRGTIEQAGVILGSFLRK